MGGAIAADAMLGRQLTFDDPLRYTEHRERDGGYTDPRRSRAGFGALLLGYYQGGDLVYAGKVGTGFNASTLRDLHDVLARLEQDSPPFRRGQLPPRRGVHWVSPRLVGQVAFTEWTEDGQLRHPRFQGLRDDKEPRDVVREVPS